MNAQTKEVVAADANAWELPAPAEPQSAATALISVIERIALMPNANLDALDRMVALRERIQASEAKAAYARDLAAMQPKLPVIERRGQIKVGTDVRSRYALWEDVNEAIKPFLAEHGFALSFRVAQTDKIVVTGILSHREGHSEQTDMTLPVDASGAKNAVQAIGSSVSYGKRYTAGALLNLTSRDALEADDSGMKAAAEPTLSDEQVMEIRDLLEANGKDEKKLLAKLKVERLEDIFAKNFERVCALFDGEDAK